MRPDVLRLHLVFPTLVGVNRVPVVLVRVDVSVPHACGGEPVKRGPKKGTRAVFPTLVGVNRIRATPAANCRTCSPRLWG